MFRLEASAKYTALSIAQSSWISIGLVHFVNPCAFGQLQHHTVYVRAVLGALFVDLKYSENILMVLMGMLGKGGLVNK